jgi:hypothetical protein
MERRADSIESVHLRRRQHYVREVEHDGTAGSPPDRRLTAPIASAPHFAGCLSAAHR